MEGEEPGLFCRVIFTLIFSVIIILKDIIK